MSFDIIALSAYEESDQTEAFEIWKSNNKSTIKQLFENWCYNSGCICQECTIGPMRGNYYVTVKPAAPKPQEIWPFNSLTKQTTR